MDDEETVAMITATVKLATHALDGAGLSDDELDALSDAVVDPRVLMARSKASN